MDPKNRIKAHLLTMQGKVPCITEGWHGSQRLRVTVTKTVGDFLKGETIFAYRDGVIPRTRRKVEWA
jgi:hypothetical protein